MKLHELQRIFGFSDEDLAANQRGAESARQYERRVYAQRRMAMLGVVLPAIFIIVTGQFQSLAAQGIGLTGGVFAALAMIYIALAWYEPIVFQVTGRVTFVIDHRRSGIYRFMFVDGIYFHVQPHVLPEFRGDDLYTVYFQTRPGIRLMLSMEPASSAEPI